jgi:DNA polymerase-3 subunit alpha
MFIHLRTKSEYSLLESILEIKDIADLALQHKMPAVAIGDLNNLCGSLEFCEEAAKKKIQPIIGIDLSIEIFLEKTKEYRLCNIILLCQSEIGYKNLISISKNYFEKKLLNQYLNTADIADHAEDLICLSGFDKGILWIAGKDNWHSIVNRLREIFDKNRFYVEIQRHGLQKEKEIEEFSLMVAKEADLPIVATNNVLFKKRELHMAHEVAICIKDGSYVSDQNRRFSSPESYFKSQEEMKDLFSDLPEAILNTEIIARRCYFKAEKRAPALPKYSNDEAAELKIQANQGLQEKKAKDLIKNESLYQERLDFELRVINEMGFDGYFLIVGDFINWSKKNDIPVGPGRGSAAGSLVAWCVGITDVDPIRFGLLFERFLNPERVSMPDIDVDFCQEKRDKVIEYIQKKYGRDNVAHIITFGALQAKAALRDVGRVLGMPYSQVDAICKMIPFNPANPITLAEAIRLDPQLQEQAKENETIKTLLEISLELEGLLRNQSTHAAGVVISDKPLHEIIPVCRDLSSGALVTQFHMKSVENSGLVKFDFLGLTTLTLLNRLYKLIKERHKIDIDFEKMDRDLDDKSAFEMLAKGDSVGIFQLESGIMRDGLKKIRADSFEDIVALTSLNRPGPMENLPDYIARKFGRKEIDYLHPSLQNLLKETFGIIVYQEQVMEIARILAGYSLGAADILRRAMGKKIQAEMDAQKEIFIDGATKNGIERDRADYIFELVNKFAGYGFNKSHATAYSLISYYTAWLKVHYSIEFLTVLMNLESHDTDKLVILKNDAEKLGIKILPPDINISQAEFSIEGKNIRYGIIACKNTGRAISDEIVENRDKNGKFKSLSDFLSRLSIKTINKKFLEAMIKCGAFDSFHSNRAELFHSVEEMILFKNKSDENSGQASLFGSQDAEFVITKKRPDWTLQEKIRNEFEGIGFYLTVNPISLYSSFLEARNVTNSYDIGEITYTTELAMAGAVTYVRIRSSKRGKFANITLSDEGGLYDLFIYDDDLIQNKGYLLKEGEVIFCKVRANPDRESGLMRLSILDFDNLLSLIKQEKAVFEIEISQDLDCISLEKALSEKNDDGKTGYHFCYFYNGYRVDLPMREKFDFPLDLQKIKRVDGVKMVKRVI